MWSGTPVALVAWTCVATALLLGLTGCGSTSATTTTSASSPKQWAEGTCAALVSWEQQAKKAASSIKSNRTREGASQAADEVKVATQNLAHSLASLGKPSTQAGSDARSTLDALQTQLHDGVAKVEDAAKGISGVSGSVAAISTISTSLVTMRDQVAAAAKQLRELPSGELQQAFTDAPSCVDLRNQTSSGG
ncbi:MAG TPA: hypothetical protein VH210_02905 [Gaiellaceae bacterium]|jgi:hypothetical protein|nr:hypothetical protein [Gaiellaceae bacterium]